MKVLVCEISYRRFYRGENEGYHIVDDNDATNFINFNGDYYGFFKGEGLADEMSKHHQEVDYVIFVAKDQKKISRIVGWYKQVRLYKDMQYFDVQKPFYVTAKDKNVVLLDEKDRTFILDIQGPYQWVEADRRLHHFLKQTRRINYITEDFNRSITMPLQSLEITCQFIEKEMAEMNYLKALQLVNRALTTYGRLASLIYYKAWVLYGFLQYRQASQLLFAIKDVVAFHDFACYMLGNIYFETEDYQTSIAMFLENKTVNQDQNAYMLAQAYAMENMTSQAIATIGKAIQLNPSEEVYREFEISLRKWSNA